VFSSFLLYGFLFPRDISFRKTDWIQSLGCLGDQKAVTATATKTAMTKAMTMTMETKTMAEESGRGNTDVTSIKIFHTLSRQYPIRLSAYQAEKVILFG
jgi:hypothetical protein